MSQGDETGKPLHELAMRVGLWGGQISEQNFKNLRKEPPLV
jgi:hypothetical protein